MTIIGALVAFWPLVLLQLVLMTWALIDISRRGETRYLPKVAWVLIVIFVSTIGPIAYFVLGREQ